MVEARQLTSWMLLFLGFREKQFLSVQETQTQTDRQTDRGESVVCSSITDTYSSASWIVIGYIPHKNRLHPHLGSKDHLLLFLSHLGTMLIEGSIPCIFEETPPNKRALFHVLWNHNMLNKYFIKTWAQCCYTLPLMINWWKKWNDFVKIEFNLHENVNWHCM